MAEQTTNFKFIKPTLDDPPDFSAVGELAVEVDSEMKLLNDAIAAANTGLGAATTNISALNTGLSSANAQIKILSSGLNADNAQIRSLSSGLSLANTQIAALSTGLTAVNESISGFAPQKPYPATVAGNAATVTIPGYTVGNSYPVALSTAITDAAIVTVNNEYGPLPLVDMAGAAIKSAVAGAVLYIRQANGNFIASVKGGGSGGGGTVSGNGVINVDDSATQAVCQDENYAPVGEAPDLTPINTTETVTCTLS